MNDRETLARLIAQGLDDRDLDAYRQRWNDRGAYELELLEAADYILASDWFTEVRDLAVLQAELRNEFWRALHPHASASFESEPHQS